MNSTTAISYISVKDAAARLGVTVVAVRRYAHAGLLAYKLKNNRAFLILESSVDDLKNSWEHPMRHSTA